MKLINKSIEKILKNEIFIILFYFSALKPYYIYTNVQLNMFFNLIFLISSLLIFIYYFINKDFSKYQKILILYLISSLVPTIIFSHCYIDWIKMFIKILSISLFTELSINNNSRKYLNSLSILMYYLISLTFITTLLFPNGIFGNEMILLGYDNETIALLILGSMITLINYVNEYYLTNDKKNIILGIVPFIMTIIIYYIRWSVGALIGCFIISLFLLLYIIINKFYKSMLIKFKKIINLRTLYICVFALFILVVIFNVQNYFSFIIVDILKKDITLSGRVNIWNDYLSFIKKNIFIGIGYNPKRILFDAYHPHNLFLNVLLESGIVGFIIYLLFWKLIIKSLDSQSNLLSYIIKIVLFSYLIMSMVDVIHGSELLYVILAIGYFLPSLVEEKNKCLKKKILVVVDTGLPIPAVCGGAVENLVDSYLKYNKDYIIDVYSTNYENNFHLSKGDINYYYIKNRGLDYYFLKLYYYALNKIFKFTRFSPFANFLIEKLEITNKKEYYDYIIVENTPNSILQLKRKISGKYILHLHNDINVIGYDKKSLKCYYKIICCSNFVADGVKKVLKFSNNIYTVYNGIDTEKLLKYNNNDCRKEMRNRYRIPNDNIVLGYCGRICDDKGVKELIEAFIKLKNKKISLIIAGSSFFKNSSKTRYLDDLIEMSKNKNIIFTGYLDNNKIGKFYSMIDILVVPSKVNEALSLASIEAQIMHKTVVATNNGGIPETKITPILYFIDRKNLSANIEKKIKNILEGNLYKKDIEKVNYTKFTQHNYSYEFYKHLN